ncbi:MAG: hypothetical protein HY906_25020 [Deltaproteobacteria bacterium]|nr:hypothetical protein [Deltaproteobacteria bacterium]
MRPASPRWPRLRARVRTGNLVLMGALLAYAIAVAASGLLGGVVVRRLDALTSPIVRVLLGLCVWDAGKALGVALGAVALAKLADVGPRGCGIALCCATYALDLGVAVLLGQLRGPWTDPAAILGRGALAVLIGWMAVAILRRLGARWHPRAASSEPPPARSADPPAGEPP